jgi:hypothetical protein
MLTDSQVKELIDNVSACISNEDKLAQEYFCIQLKDMNKDLGNWNDLSIKEQMGLRSAFKEIMMMNEIGKLIRNSS